MNKGEIAFAMGFTIGMFCALQVTITALNSINIRLAREALTLTFGIIVFIVYFIAKVNDWRKSR